MAKHPVKLIKVALFFAIGFNLALTIDYCVGHCQFTGCHCAQYLHRHHGVLCQGCMSLHPPCCCKSTCGHYLCPRQSWHGLLGLEHHSIVYQMVLPLGLCLSECPELTLDEDTRICG
jgi:hypothetical protein